MIMGMCIGCSPYNAEQTVITQAIAVLRRFGTDAHVYLPGVGMMNGLQAGNYLDSAGTTAATVDQPVGLVLDSAGSLGVELSPGTGTTVGWSAINATLASSGGNIIATATVSGAGAVQVYFDIATTVGSTYKLSENIAGYTATLMTSLRLRATTTAFAIIAEDVLAGPELGELYFVATATTTRIIVRLDATFVSGVSTLTLNASSVREVTGIHAQQPTTASKPLLRRGAVNLLTYSGDFTNAAWSLVGTASKVGSTLSMPSLDDAVFHTTTAAATASTGAVMLSGTGSLSLWLFNSTDFAIGLKQITLTSEPTLYFVNATPTVAGSTLRFGRRTGDTATSVTFGSAALFQGTYTAQQIQALGGIPLTLTAPVSTALGAYWWDTSGSKSLVATFPAGNESVTVINATPTGQVTTTAQNVVGAYNINTNTNGRIIINGALTTPELTLLQSLANRMAQV